MIKLFYKALIVVICSIAFINSARSQELYPTQPQLEKEYQTGKFSAVCVSSNLQVTLQEGVCGVKITSDEALLPYINVTVRGNILYLEYDEKAVPREIKRTYRGKNAPIPMMKASVFTPVLNGITASQNAVIVGKGTVFADDAEIKLTDKAQLKDLEMDAENIRLSMEKSTVASLTLSAESQLEVSLDGNSQLKLRYKCRNLLLNQEGNSTVIMEGEYATSSFTISGYTKSRCTGKGNVLVLDTRGNTDISLAGETGDFTLTSERAAKVDALELKASRVKASLNGWTSANVHAEEFLSVNLTSGSTLIYSGIPAIHIDKIMKSTLVSVEEETKK